jgi:hypothetical protein
VTKDGLDVRAQGAGFDEAGDGLHAGRGRPRREARYAEGVPGDRVEDDVDVFDGLGEVDGPAVDDLVRSEGAQEVVVGGAGGADHVRAAGLGDLDGGGATLLLPAAPEGSG